MTTQFIRLNPSSLTRESVRDLYLDLSKAIDNLVNSETNWKIIKKSLNICEGRLETMLNAVNKIDNLIPELEEDSNKEY